MRSPIGCHTFIIRPGISFLALFAAEIHRSAVSENAGEARSRNKCYQSWQCLVATWEVGERKDRIATRTGRDEGAAGLEDVSNDKAIKREGIKRDKGTGVQATTSPGRHKEGTALSPLNFRKAKKYSSAAEKQICVTPS